MRNGLLAIMALVALLCGGCGLILGPKVAPATPTTQPRTLYDRLGGKKAITDVVDDFVSRAAADPKVNFTRKGIPNAEFDPTPQNVIHLKSQLVDFISQATGGPKEYKGQNMKDSHRHMQITSAEFDAMATDLKATLDKFHVPSKEQAELMTIVGSTKKDIVTK